ncbi:MAG TPA: hypothetical protein VJX72_08500 [Candidatus Acidoferrum sp.]|jgi:hypothetical protein|nr:hypothetical protein [Candidatus Acidoferrum sp.]
MILSNLILAAILVLVIGSIVFGAAVAFRTYLRYRGQRLVTCPETHQAAAVHVNAGKALSTTLIGKQAIRLDQCSRWPEKRNCGQECLSQVNADPEHCLVWNIVAAWYKGKSCAYCQRPFGEIHWHDRHPALLSPERIAKQWNEIPAEQLPGVFETHLPVCWNCYIAETYRRQNPDGVLNRTWERGAGGEYVPKEEETTPQKRAAGR